MRWFSGLTVAKRLTVLVFSAAFGLIFVAGIALYQIRQVYDGASYASVNTVPSLLVLDDAQSAFDLMRVLVYQHLLATGNGEKTTLETRIGALQGRLVDALKRYEPLLSDEHDRSMLMADRDLLSAYELARDQVLAQSHVDATVAVALAKERMFPAANKLSAALADHRSYNAQLGRQGADDAASLVSRVQWMLVALTLSTVTVAVLIGFLIVRHLLRELGGEPAYAAEIANRIAGNDLTAMIQTTTEDRSSLLYSMKRMQAQLTKTISTIKLSADTITIAVHEIAVGNQDLSQRTEEQAASLEETAASMEQLTATVTQNADNARQANQLAAQAASVAEQGGVVVSRMVETMDGIHASSDKIADIVGIIEGIAFQTNILALNAAVEAARAGEQGRGFAVVAGEVRLLAQRSSSASREIKDLIQDSVERVQAGADYVREAGSKMTEITHEIRRVTDIMNEIAAASQEQSKGISQVNQAVSQMDEVTQQNAALVEQAAAAASSLESQAGELKAAVSMFTLDEPSLSGGARSVVALPPPATSAHPAQDRPLSLLRY